MTKGDYTREVAEYLAGCDNDELAYAIAEILGNKLKYNEIQKKVLKAATRLENESECTRDEEMLLKKIKEENMKREQTDIGEDKEYLQRMETAHELMGKFMDALSM